MRQAPALPALAERSATTGPIDLNDWMALIEPMPSDLSNSSGIWADIGTKPLAAAPLTHFKNLMGMGKLGLHAGRGPDHFAGAANLGCCSTGS